MSMKSVIFYYLLRHACARFANESCPILRTGRRVAGSTGSLTSPTTPPQPMWRRTVHTAGICFSCASSSSIPEFGRCSLAWRLAIQVPIAADLAAVYDTTKVVA